MLTDGNENVHPYVDELPAGTITDRTYAIGFGLPGGVSDAVLNQITANTHGDLIITGDISTAEQGFNLTKYFVQMLAGITRMNVILDPQGSLFFGGKDVIPFDVTASDVYMDVMTLCPLPRLLDFTLVCPDGTVIKPSSAGANPNIKFVVSNQVAFYRITLPAIARKAAGSHAGKWKAIVALKGKDEVQKLLREKRLVEALRTAAIGQSVPYSLVAHVYSNLSLEAVLHQDSLKPGATVALSASLKEYDVEFAGNAAVWAEIRNPDGSTQTLTLQKIADGKYSGTFKTISAGVYACRVRAQGYTRASHPFTREKTLTAGVYYGNYGPAPDNPSDRLCEIIECLLSGKVLSKRAEKELADRGIDLKYLLECLREHCRPGIPERARGKVRPAAKEVKIVLRTAAFAKPVKEVKAKALPMHLKDRMREGPRIISMFPSSEGQIPDLTPLAGADHKLIDRHSGRGGHHPAKDAPAPASTKRRKGKKRTRG